MSFFVHSTLVLKVRVCGMKGCFYRLPTCSPPSPSFGRTGVGVHLGKKRWISNLFPTIFAYSIWQQRAEAPFVCTIDEQEGLFAILNFVSHILHFRRTMPYTYSKAECCRTCVYNVYCILYRTYVRRLYEKGFDQNYW